MNKSYNASIVPGIPDRDPLLGEIAYVKMGCVQHPIIFTNSGWSFVIRPDHIDPSLIIRDDVCRWPKGLRRATVPSP